MKLPFEIDLRNKIVVITGAGGVLCSMMAKALAQSGAKTALLNRSLESVLKVEEEIIAAGGCAKAFECNVLDKVSIQRTHDAITEEWGTCDILINGAGGNHPMATTEDEFFKQEDLGNMKTFFDLDTEGIEAVFNLNYIGTLLPSQVFALDMVGKKDATIINISSMNAFSPLTKIPAYSGAKAAVSNLTQWMAVHFSKSGIRCNAIAPGFFLSNQNKNLLFQEDGTPTSRADKILTNTPMERFGQPEELIGTLLFLISHEASGFITGVILPVDGGFSAYSGV